MKNRKSDGKHVGGGIRLVCILLYLAFALMRGEAQAGQTAKDEPTATSVPPNELVVTLKEVPVWELDGERVRGFFLRGQSARLVQDQGQLSQAKYPKFTSNTPLYGEMRFFNDAAGRRHLRFVLDCSDPAGDYDRLYFDETYDTRELYGTVSGSREVTISRK